MRADIVPGATFPDYELPDHTKTPRTLSEIQGDDPLILTLARGHYCPKEHQQHLELAPIRVNLIAPGFVDTPLSAAILGDQLDARREQLRRTLPIRRVVSPVDVAALAVHLMTNTAVTGATYDIDGGQQLL